MMALLRNWCALFCSSLPVLSSFLAIGPLAALRPVKLGSANSLNGEDVEVAWRNVHLNSFSSRNSTSETNLSRLSNQTTESNHSSIAGGYFWLSDPTYDHRVNAMAVLCNIC
jgi:hypothetical protein